MTTRLRSVDVFRGATVAAMLLVNNPGSWSHVYGPLLHAEWHGWTPTDLIFPFFLFVVGITSHLSLERHRAAGADDRSVIARILMRGVLIVLFGVILNWFPFYTWGAVPGVEEPELSQRIVHRWEHLRWSGVLQRIGIVYLLTAPLVWKLRARAFAVIASVVLIGYAVLLLVVPVPDTGLTGSAAIADPDHTIAAWTDRLILGRAHIWRGGMWDPEGPLSTLPAVATALLGVLTGRLLTSSQPLERRVRRLLAWGIAGVAAGYLGSVALPINKNLWTSSYVLFTAGAGALLLAFIAWLIDIRKVRRGTGFFVTFGLNPLVAFLGSGLMARLTDSLVRFRVDGQSRTLHTFVHDTLFRSWLPENPASLAYAVMFVLIWYLILKVFERRGWIIKV